MGLSHWGRIRLEASREATNKAWVLGSERFKERRPPLPDARWRLSPHRRHAGFPARAGPHHGAAASLAHSDHQACHEGLDAERRVIGGCKINCVTGYLSPFIFEGGKDGQKQNEHGCALG